MKKTPKIFVSDRFLRSYRKAGVKLQKLAEAKIHYFIGQLRSDERSVSNHYDKLAHCKNRILEVDISAADRLLADYTGNRIILLDMGDHDVVPRYSDEKYKHDVKRLEPAPRSFYPIDSSGFFISNPDRTVSIGYKEEVTDEWLYYLDDEQNKVREEIFDSILDEIDFSALIVGGPGTGKTCVLLNLLKDFADSEFSTGIVISEKLSDYIERSTGFNISKFEIDLTEDTDVDILLCDDPPRSQLELAAELKRNGAVQYFVAGFDPLQLDTLFSDQEFNKFKYDNDLELFRLKNCYRQKLNLGSNTKTVADKIASSSPFLREDRIEEFRRRHAKITALSNELEFLNPHGYIKYYETSTLDNIASEIARISAVKSSMWKHAPGLLILLDECELTVEALELFKKLDRMNYYDMLPLDRVEDIKGLEYQHVFIFMQNSQFNEIQNGFKGTGRRVYEKRRLLRIPFSRAKDSLVTFAVEDND